MKIFKKYFFLFFGYLIINVLSIEILQKYKSIETSDIRIAFDSSEFEEGKKMYFEFKTDFDCECDDYLYYQYYDNFDNINNIDNIDYYYNKTIYNKGKMYSVKSYSKSTVTINNKKSITKNYEIEKKKEELNDLNGNYLYLEFDCCGPVKITNSETSGNTTMIILIVVLVAAVIGVFAYVIYRRCRRRRMELMNGPYPYSEGYPYPANTYFPQQPGYPPPYGNASHAQVYNAPYTTPNGIIHNPNDSNDNDMPTKIQVIPKGGNIPPGAIPQISSKRNMKPKKMKKPKKMV